MRAILVVTCLLVPAIAIAHEIGTTDVRLTVRPGGEWDAVITTGPQSLLDKLDVEAGLPRSATADASVLASRLEPLVPRIANHIDLRFDGVSSTASVTLARLELPADAARPSFAVLSAHGLVPSTARTVTWSYGLVYSTYALVLARSDADARPSTTWLDADATSPPLSLVPGDGPTYRHTIGQYLRLGFEHIVPRGVDHILFVLGIFLLTTSIRAILVQVTAFTLAHSLTLGLTMYGVLALPPRIVEPLITLSIAYVAVENVLTSRLTPWRPAVVFAFGLLHGMGFAGVLQRLQLPREQFLPALVSFNLGIELAQLAVIGAAFGSVARWYRNRPWYRERVVVPASGLIAAVGVVWTIQRVLTP